MKIRPRRISAVLCSVGIVMVGHGGALAAGAHESETETTASRAPPARALGWGAALLEAARRPLAVDLVEPLRRAGVDHA